MLDLKIDRAAAPPKDAATVILVRDRAEGAVEVFCVERSKQSRFLGGAIVFPGGKLDPSDASDDWTGALATAVRSPRPSSVAFTTSEAHLRSLAIAAARETLEEAALLHVVGASGDRELVSDRELLDLRGRLSSDPGALRAFLHGRGLKLDLSSLHPLSRWITPEAEARRYDARFFVAIAPEGQSGAHDEHETMASFWATPTEVLQRFDAGEVQVAPPTHSTLAILQACRDTRDVLEVVAASSLDPICPKLVQQTDPGGATTLALTLPGDPEHDVREQRVPGRSRYVLRGERWLPEDPPEA